MIQVQSSIDAVQDTKSKAINSKNALWNIK